MSASRAVKHIGHLCASNSSGRVLNCSKKKNGRTCKFRRGSKDLIARYNALCTVSFHFIANFGTHYIKKVHMGAMFGEQTEFSKESWHQLEERKINVDAAAEFSGDNYLS